MAVASSHLVLQKLFSVFLTRSHVIIFRSEQLTTLIASRFAKLFCFFGSIACLRSSILSNCDSQQWMCRLLGCLDVLGCVVAWLLGCRLLGCLAAWLRGCLVALGCLAACCLGAWSLEITLRGCVVVWLLGCLVRLLGSVAWLLGSWLLGCSVAWTRTRQLRTSETMPDLTKISQGNLISKLSKFCFRRLCCWLSIDGYW
jgi:hypothetical protein